MQKAIKSIQFKKRTQGCISLLTLLKLASISKYWSPFCTKVMRAPGGTKLPSIGHLLMPASYPKAKAECVNPAKKI